MPYDGTLLARARDRLEQIRTENQEEQVRRKDEIYRRIPEVSELDARMRRQMREVLRLSFTAGGDPAPQLDAIRRENLELQVRKGELLYSHGYPADYLTDIYTCPRCKDTGNVGSEVCTCLQQLYNRELTRELSSIGTGSESFTGFDLNLYDNLPDASGHAPRDIMRGVLAACRKFADNFPAVSTNLLLQGGTGLGKTYLSACIASAVAGKGYSVCYESASAALEAFEVQKFSYDPKTVETARQRVNRMLESDLLILDDLGTEMTTQMSISALYTLLNTRLNNGKTMVISTNLSFDELRKRYTPQILSRLEGCFLRLPFVGKDIRLLLKK